MKNKKGISSFVATVLLILITLSAVGILWGAIMPIFDKSMQEQNNQEFAIKLCYNETAIAYCDSLNMSFYGVYFDNVFPDNKHFTCGTERTGEWRRYYFLKDEIERCESGKKDN